MIIVQIIGGLGNQMFQYAFGRAVAAERRCPLYLDVDGFSTYHRHQGFELPAVFRISMPVAGGGIVRKALGICAAKVCRQLLRKNVFSMFRGRRFVCESKRGMLTPNALTNGCYFAGYWQSENYFLKCETLIREDFRFAAEEGIQNRLLSEKMVTCNAISLHVRRGDYVSDTRALASHGLCSLDYYRRAIDYICKRTSAPEFFVFSDDALWARQNLRIGAPTHYVTHNQGANSYHDMALMSRCRHHIIANSSFSWWGAWLNPSTSKIVVAPQQWFADPRLAARGAAVVPNRWVRL